jgi:hypothetical protein
MTTDLRTHEPVPIQRGFDFEGGFFGQFDMGNSPDFGFHAAWTQRF